jgi:hypothetical protein
MQPYRHTARRCVLYYSLQRKEASSADYGRLDLFIVSPSIHATVGVKNTARQCVNDYLPPALLHDPEITPER